MSLAQDVISVLSKSRAQRCRGFEEGPEGGGAVLGKQNGFSFVGI